MLGMRLSADAHAIKIASPLHKYLVAPTRGTRDTRNEHKRYHARTLRTAITVLPMRVFAVRFFVFTKFARTLLVFGWGKWDNNRIVLILQGRFSMKKIVLAFVACFSIQVFALTEGDYTYTVSNGKATITDFPETVSGAIEIPSTLGGYPVTSIVGYAFYDCSSLTSVVIPEGVTYIREKAFYNCSGLTSVVIPEGVTSIGHYAFYNCSGLTSVVIPEGVTSIGNDAFYNCSGLTSVMISEGVTSIGASAFYNCSGLTSVVIPEGVTYIGSYAFKGCSGLTSVVFPESVTSIERAAFSDCSGLTSVVIPKGMEIIEDFVFSDCSGLTSVVIPEGVKSIRSYAFKGCSGLTSVEIPASVVTVGEGAFYYCPYVVALCDVPYAYKKFCNSLICYPQKYAQNWEKVLGANARATYVENISSALVDVKTEMLTPKTMKVTYKVTGVKNADAKVKTHAVAFTDGVRSFANIVPVKSGENVPDGGEVAAGVEHSFVWNVPEDWDEDLAKVKVEILVQEGQLLPQELITIPANGTNKVMTITRNSIPEYLLFNALLWCYAGGDGALTLSSGVLKANGTTICNGSTLSSGSYYRPLLNYLYGKMGYKVLTGDDLAYAKKATRINFASSGLNQVAVKIEE